MGALYYAANPGGLTMPQIWVLSALDRHGPHTTIDLVGLVGIDRTTLFGIVARLRRDGMILAEQVPPGLSHGPRPIRLRISPRGRRALNEAETPLWNAEVQLMSRLTPGERSAFLNAVAITAYSGPKP